MSETFVLKTKLNVSDEQAHELNKLMGIYCHIQNVLVKHAISCIDNLHRDTLYRIIMSNKIDTLEKELLNNLLRKYGLSQYQFHAYIMKQNKLFKGKTNSHIVQKVSDRVWQSVEKYLFHNGKKIHFKPRRLFDSFANKNTSTGIRFDGHNILINKMEIPVFIRKKDDYLLDNLTTHRIKYFQIKRKRHKHSYRYYVYFYMEGVLHSAYTQQTGKVGIDIGPSTIAVVSNKEVFIQELAEGVDSIDQELYRLQRKRDRQNRANNPNNFNDDGTVKRNRKQWIRSKSMKQTDDKIITLYNKRKNCMEYSHNVLSKRILSLGNEIIVEDMDWSALSKHAKETKVNEKTGRYQKKKRFGKSIHNHAPAMLIEMIARKAKLYGAVVIKVDCFKAKATQYDHIRDEFIKHDLNERAVLIGNDLIQRDLHSAFNLMNIMISNNEYSYDRDNMIHTYPNFLSAHNICMSLINNKRKAGINIPACI